MNEIILKERETKEKLVQLLNESQLPAVVLKPILKEVLEQLNILEQQQYTIACQSGQEHTESEGEEDG